MPDMRAFLVIVLLGTLSFFQAPAEAQPRSYNQAELDALLAPVALYPDPLLTHILVAATYPDDVRDAAAWSRANPHLKGDEAVRAAEPMPWHPGLKALLAFPDLLARMDESPQWTADLGAAFLTQEPEVMTTVQALRYRAQASGALQQPEYRHLVQPVQTQVVYVPYYNPLVVYGPWWWHSHRPVMWRPWHSPRPVIIHKPVIVHQHVRQAPIARHVPRAVPVQPGFERHEHRRGHREQFRPQGSFQVHGARPIIQGALQQPHFAGGSPNSARLSSNRGKPDDHRDAGRRHHGGAGGNAPHPRRAH